ncbi:hypothetical protein Tco_0443859, partial [Tanacetum coccineum]
MEMRRTTLGEGALALIQQMVISPPCLTKLILKNAKGDLLPLEVAKATLLVK